MRILSKFVLIVFVILIIITVIAICFMNLWKPFGDKLSMEDKKFYKKAANYDFEKGKFFNESEYKLIGNTGENKFVSNKDAIPKNIIKSEKPSLNEKLMLDDLNVTWFGHSSVFLQMHGMRCLK